MDWYEGTADAVRKNLRYLLQPWIDYVLILSGDQLYRMDYSQMLDTHIESGADVSIASLPVTREAARGFGVMRLNDSGRVEGFLEKPQEEHEIDSVRMDPAWIDAHGIQSAGRDCLASMGIYLFNRDTLVDVLRKTNYQDFGKEVFPAAIRARHVQAFLFDGYWEDIGTIRSFFDSNLALAQPSPPFELASETAPLYSRARYLPPTRMDGATIRNSLIANGCMIGDGATIENSVIGLRCNIGPNVTIRNSVLMGHDQYTTPEEHAEDQRTQRPPFGIGEGTRIEGAIIDKNVHIGRNVKVVNPSDVDRADISDGCYIRDGICVVEKDAVLVDGWELKL